MGAGSLSRGQSGRVVALKTHRLLSVEDEWPEQYFYIPSETSWSVA